MDNLPLATLIHQSLSRTDLVFASTTIITRLLIAANNYPTTPVAAAEVELLIMLGYSTLFSGWEPNGST